MNVSEAQQLSAKESLRLGELLAAVEIIAEADKDMPMRMMQAMILLMIEDGLGPNEIARKMGVVPAIASRHISDLGDQVVSGCLRAAGGDPENKRTTRARCSGRTQGAQRQFM